MALNIRHQLPHRLRLDCPQELSNAQLLLITAALNQLEPDWLVRAAAHRRGLVVSSLPEQRLCPAVVAGLVDAALRAPDPHGPTEPPTAFQRWLDQSRQGSIKVLMALAIAGWVLPILPGTPFFLLAWWLGWRPEPEQEPEASAEASTETELQPALLQPST